MRQSSQPFVTHADVADLWREVAKARAVKGDAEGSRRASSNAGYVEDAHEWWTATSPQIFRRGRP